MWHFREPIPGDPTRDPIVGEFFSTDAISNPAEALVREGIQNSLDAALHGGPVKIRLALGTGSWQLSPAMVATWLGSAWDHIQAPGNGLREAPSASESCPFLVFEDFGTSGLTGDPGQPFDEPGSRNLFFYFFRAEGRSSKGETDRGRWGVGKHVFPRSSAISTTFAYTARADDRRKLLMGHAILKSHKIGTRHFTPDAYFGVPRHDRLVMPFEEPSVLDRFRSEFRLARNDEPGLSVVVPYIDPDITFSNLLTGVIRDYFHPILEGKLSVEIDSPDNSVTVTSSTLVDVALSLETSVQGDILQLVDLAEWYSSKGRSAIVELPPCNPDRPEWTDDLIPPSLVPELRRLLDAGERLAVRCRLSVREKGRPTRESFFDVCLRQDDNESGRAVFIREGIIVSDVKAPRTRGIRSLVIVEDKPLATLLGDSENPAHTQWQKDSSNFKGKYVYGKSYIEFVSRAPSELVRRLRADEDTADKTLLLDVFSLPADRAEGVPTRPEPKPKKKPGDTIEDDLDAIEPRKKRFRIHRIAGGFAVTKGDAEATPPARLRIRTAYDVRKGNPLKKYSPNDFRLNLAPIALEPPPEGVTIRSIAENEIVADIASPDFHLTVAGFDQRRDLYVNVTLQEDVDAS